MVSKLRYTIKKIVYKTEYIFMIIRMAIVACFAANVIFKRSDDLLSIFMVAIIIVLFLTVETRLISEWEWKNRYWFKTIEDMKFYFEAPDNRLQWFMEMLNDFYPNTYKSIVKKNTYVEQRCSYEFCKYILSRVENLSNYSSQHYKCFIAKCTKDCSRGTQPNDPKAGMITHVLMAFHGYDTQFTTPVIIDPFYNQYMPEIIDEKDTANVRVVTDHEEMEEVYHIIELYSMDRCQYIEVGGHVKELTMPHDDLVPFCEIRNHVIPSYESKES